MKNTDIALIILIAIVSVVVSYFLGNWILGDPDELTSNMKYVNPINATLDDPDIEAFNGSMRNPTVEVYIGECPEGYEWDEDSRDCVEKIEENPDENGGNGGGTPTERPTGD